MSDRHWHLLAVLLSGLAVGCVAAAIALVGPAGYGWHDALTSFLATNGLMGVSFAVSGLLIAYHRRHNPVGWLLIGDGLGHAVAALMAPVLQMVHDHDGPLWLQRVLVTVFMGSWPWSIALFLPLALLLFPDGHLPGRAWRWVAWAVGLTAPLFALDMVSGTEPVADGMPLGYVDVTLPGWLATVSEARIVAALAIGVISLLVRYRRADEAGRRQLLWLLLAAMVVVAAVLPWSFVAGTPIAVLFTIPLIPAAIAIAVLRYRLLDIRLVVARAVAWLLLSAAALAAYVALVAVLDTVVSRAFGRSAFAPVVVAVLLAPLLPRLQREVERWMYGDRRDPARVAGRLGEHLAAGDERGLQGVVGSLRSALRLPWVAVADGTGVLAEDGERPEHVATVPLSYAGTKVGVLEIGLRPGERDLPGVDAGTLRLVAAPLAVAVGALRLSADLQASRGRLVAAREEERRRLRRDLHDGLGPALTGVALSADAAANFLDADPDRSRELLTGLREHVRGTIADVRRLVDDLRPPALDEVGLVGAIQQRADQLRLRADGSSLAVRLVAPDDLPPLPAAVEVAAYRIATEALVNVARHAGATSAEVRVQCNGILEVEVTDDGGHGSPWVPGVGLASMRERADEVGGTVEVGPSGHGGRVRAWFPLEKT
jgi:two-component system NarL family sensor kinase